MWSESRFQDHGKAMTPFDNNAIGEAGLDTGNSTLDTQAEGRSAFTAECILLSSNLGESVYGVQNQQLPS